MADSKDNDNDSNSKDFEDDLDAMLNEVESTEQPQDELIDDEDAIDRLLMDDAFDMPEDESIDEQVKQDIIEQAEQKTKPEAEETEIDEFGEDEFDEFGEDEPEESSKESSESLTEETDNMQGEADIDDLIDDIGSVSSIEEDEFAEIGGLPEEKADADVKEQKDDEATPEVAEDDELTDAAVETESDDDFLMADFDISADDEFTEEEANINVESEPDEVETASDPEPKLAPESQEEKPLEEKLDDNGVDISAITAQLNQLNIDNETLKQQIVELTSLTSQNDKTAEELEDIQKDQRKLRKIIKESEDKVPVIVYISIGIAVLALLVGGGLGIVGYGAQSDVTELSELVTTLEEEIEILTTKDASRDIKQINEKINLLTAKDDHTSRQIDELSDLVESNPLQSKVDDLAKQSDQSQEEIDQLLSKVEALQKSKTSTTRKKTKKAATAVTWVVNLVSFKQEWYAKRKAAEFEKKAVPVKIVKVKVKGENWFRLTVKGFKTKYEAAAYAVKVKKTLNLSSAWVTKG